MKKEKERKKEKGALLKLRAMVKVTEGARRECPSKGNGQSASRSFNSVLLCEDGSCECWAWGLKDPGSRGGLSGERS